MAEQRVTGAWVPWVVAVCCVVGFAVGIGALVIADEWGDRITALMVVAFSVAGVGGVRRAFATVRRG